MTWMKRLGASDSGFTVVELVIAAVILLVVSTGVMGVLAYAGTSNASNAMRQMGLELANQRMEQARAMPYDSLGTSNGYPTGTIVTPETVSLSTPEGARTFVVVTEVDWAVDAATGLAGDKNVRITVSWTVPRAGSVTIESNVVGKSAITNAGDVKVNVVDSDTSDPVPGATITIKPASGTSATKSTGPEGYVRWGRVGAGSITITGTCSTHYLDMSPVTGATVIADQLNEWTVQGERASSGTVHVVDQNGNPLSGVTVTLTGPGAYANWSCGTSGIGTKQTDENGDAVFSLLRKGTYTVKGARSGYTQQTSPPNLVVSAGGSAYSSTLVMNIATTIKVKVVDASDDPMPGVTVTGTGPSSVTFATTTDANGEVTSNDMGSIGANKTYTIAASKTGYLTSTGTVTMSQYSQGTITLKLVVAPATTIKVTVKDGSGNPISGATVSASGPSAVTFASTTDSNGQVTSNDMGAIGTGKSYTVTAAKSGWVTNTGTVTASQYAQWPVSITLAAAPVNGTLNVTYTSSLSSSKTIYIYSSNTTGATSIASKTVTSSSPTASFSLPAGTYWASRRSPYGNFGATPVQVVVSSGVPVSINIDSTD